jgi:hypothetical protein
MSPATRDAKQQANARQRRRLKAHERLARDRRQAQHAAQALEQAFKDLGLPETLVAELEGRLRRQQKLLSKIVGLMCPPSLVVAPTQNYTACEGGIRTSPHACSVHCRSAPGSSA